MLVDINAYVGHWPFRRLNHNTCKTLVTRMNQHGVEISVISNLHGIFYQNTQHANEELFEELASDKAMASRLIPFAVINPAYAGWKDDLDTCINRFGMRGIRLYPRYHGYSLDNPSCVELANTARDMDVPIALSLRMADSRCSSWMDLEGETEWDLKDVASIVNEVPAAKYLILNVANSTRLNDRETASLKNGSVLMDSSGRAMNRLNGLLRVFGPEKFAFGTHSPILDYHTGRLRIEALKPDEADDNTKELLRSGNAKQFLRL